MQLWRQTTVNAQELLVHNSSQWQGTEGLHTRLVNILRILVLTFQLEGKVIGQMATLVVTTEQPQAVWIPNLQRPQVKHTLDGEVASVDVVSQEQISGIGWVTTDLEQLHQIIVLAVNISTDGDWRIHLEQVWLLSENLASLVDNVDGLLLGETTFSVEMLLQECEIWLGWILLGKELLVGRCAHSWCLNIYNQVSLEASSKMGAVLYLCRLFPLC